MLGSRAFAAARTVGIYIHCERLREVDAMPILRAALQQGALFFALGEGPPCMHGVSGALHAIRTPARSLRYPCELQRRSCMPRHSPCAGKKCFVPLVDDKESNMRLLHIGRVRQARQACHAVSWGQQAHARRGLAAAMLTCMRMPRVRRLCRASVCRATVSAPRSPRQTRLTTCGRRRPLASWSHRRRTLTAGPGTTVSSALP